MGNCDQFLISWRKLIKESSDEDDSEKIYAMKWRNTNSFRSFSVFFLQLYLTLVATAVFIIPAILIAICYIIIVVIIWKRSSSSFNKQYSDAIKEKSSKKPLQNKKGNMIMWFFLFYLNHSGDLLRWVGAPRRPSWGVCRPSPVNILFFLNYWAMLYKLWYVASVGEGNPPRGASFGVKRVNLMHF